MFDDAVGKAIEFVEKDRNTTIVILPDHGNSGFNRRNGMKKGYTKMTLADLSEWFRNTKNSCRLENTVEHQAG